MKFHWTGLWILYIICFITLRKGSRMHKFREKKNSVISWNRYVEAFKISNDFFTHYNPSKIKHETLLIMMYHATEAFQLLRKVDQLSSEFSNTSIMLALCI